MLYYHYFQIHKIKIFVFSAAQKGKFQIKDKKMKSEVKKGRKTLKDYLLPYKGMNIRPKLVPVRYQLMSFIKLFYNKKLFTL